MAEDLTERVRRLRLILVLLRQPPELVLGRADLLLVW